MKNKAKYFQLSNKINEIKIVSEVGNSDVVRCGLASLDEIVGFKKGFPVFIGGAPHSGKTEIGLEWLMHLSIQRKYKWFCYLGEGGSVEDVFLELMFKYLKKPYKWASESEKVQAEYFVNEHFVIANDDLDFMIGGFYDAVTEAENELGIKFDGTFFDPFNDIEEELTKFNGREDKFLAYALKEVRKSSKKHKRIDFVVNHIADVKAIQDKDSGNFYMRAALANEWSGGRTWWRRAFLMFLIYRPPTFLKDSNGMPYAENETHVYCQKAKPKGTCKMGRRSVFWDWQKNRFYCYQEAQRLESGETLNDYIPKGITESAMKPNNDFGITVREKNEPIEEMPF